jgi:osmotically-inducible protein OsmY
MKKIVIFLILFLTSSCVEIALLSSVKTANIAIREKSLTNSGKDLMIETRLIQKLTFNKLKTPSNMVDVTVNEGRVLLTGVVENEKNAKKAIKIAWKINNVKEVIDEIQIVKNFRIFRTSSQYLKDSVITSNISSKLIFAKNISSINYQIITVNSVAYILGTASLKSEMNRVNNIAARTKGVNKVVSHIILKNDKRRRI